MNICMYCTVSPLGLYFSIVLALSRASLGVRMLLLLDIQSMYTQYKISYSACSATILLITSFPKLYYRYVLTHAVGLQS